MNINTQGGFGLTGYLAGGALIAILSITVLWQMERVNSAQLEARIEGLNGELDIMKQNLESLKSSHKEQQDTILRMADNQKSVNENIQNLQNRAFDSQAELYEAQNEINQLRATETKRSLRNPYGSGNSAHDRLLRGLRGVGGSQGRDDPDRNRPENASADDVTAAEGSSDPTGAGD